MLTDRDHQHHTLYVSQIQDDEKKLIELNKGRAKVRDKPAQKNTTITIIILLCYPRKKVTMKKTNKHILELNELKQQQGVGKKNRWAKRSDEKNVDITICSPNDTHMHKAAVATRMLL